MLTRRHGILESCEDGGIKAPVSGPVGHVTTHLEVLRKMICARRPGIHGNAAESAAGFDLRGLHLPETELETEVFWFEIVD